MHIFLYILEQRSSCSTSRIGPSWPCSWLKLRHVLASLYEHASCCHARTSILLFIAMGQVSHLAPSTIGVASHYCTSKHHNNATRHMTHMYRHHISITVHFFFLHIFHSPWQAGSPRPIMSATVNVVAPSDHIERED
jgi:hypothetical protein